MVQNCDVNHLADWYYANPPPADETWWNYIHRTIEIAMPAQGMWEGDACGSIGSFELALRSMFPDTYPTLNPCSGVPDGSYTFGDCVGGQLGVYVPPGTPPGYTGPDSDCASGYRTDGVCDPYYPPGGGVPPGGTGTCPQGDIYAGGITAGLFGCEEGYRRASGPLEGSFGDCLCIATHGGSTFTDPTTDPLTGLPKGFGLEEISKYFIYALIALVAVNLLGAFRR